MRHDIDDGLRAGLFALDELSAVPFIAGHHPRGRRSPPGVSASFRRCHEVVRRIITRMIEDVIAESARRLERHWHRRDADAIRNATVLGGGIFRRA